MAFTGKAVNSARTLSENAEDIADIVSIVSPYETPLLDHIGDPVRVATSTYHEWLDACHDRKGNWTQVFTASVRVSRSNLAVREADLAAEMDYQKQERLRELLRELEDAIINGQPAGPTDLEIAGEKEARSGSRRDVSEYLRKRREAHAVRRTMKGIIPTLTTNVFRPGENDFPTDTELTEEQLDLAIRLLWGKTNSRFDTIVVNGYQKRKINSFTKSGTNIYETDGAARCVILSRYVPANTVLLLDSVHVDVLPLAERSFYYRPLESTDDHEVGKIIGEYTVELRNEGLHGMITGLSTGSRPSRDEGDD